MPEKPLEGSVCRRECIGRSSLSPAPWVAEAKRRRSRRHRGPGTWQRRGCRLASRAQLPAARVRRADQESHAKHVGPEHDISEAPVGGNRHPTLTAGTRPLPGSPQSRAPSSTWSLRRQTGDRRRARARARPRRPAQNLRPLPVTTMTRTGRWFSACWSAQPCFACIRPVHALSRCAPFRVSVSTPSFTS